MQASLSFFVLLIASVAAAQGYPSTEYPSTALPPLVEPVEPVEAPPIPTSYADLLGPPPPPPAPAEAAAAAPAAVETTAAPVAEAAGPVTPVEASGPVAPVEASSLADAEPEVVYHWYQPAYWFGPAPWDSGIEFGLNGASGTSESLSFRTGGFIKRSADDYKFDGSLYYNKTQTEGVEVQSNALLDLRYDWLFDDSPWTLFVLSQTFYDEFQAFDINVNVNTGFGYQWLDSERQRLTTSVGTGASREFGGPIQDEWVAEASFGVKYEFDFADNKKFYAKVDHFPEWEDFTNYRLLSDVGMEFELHQPSNLSLKLAATSRYDSEPQGAEPHNLNYSALLIWKL